MREEEDAFSTDIFASVRSAFKRGMVNTVKGKSKEQHRQLSEQRAAFECQIAQCRMAAARERELLVAGEVSRAQQAATAHAAHVRSNMEHALSAACLRDLGGWTCARVPGLLREGCRSLRV